MKKIFTILFVFTLVFNQYIYSQCSTPSTYYSSITNQTGETLRTALSTIINNGTGSVSYSGLWGVYDQTDMKSGYIWDIYTDNCNFVYSNDQCGTYSSICDCYNREHTVPQSWFGEATPMVSDVFHVLPTDGKVNGMRSNYPYGECSSGTVYGTGRLGSCTFPGYSGTVFEPADQYKGDIARIYFYMATRYKSQCSSWSGASFGTSQGFSTWTLNLLKKWNAQDPVSQKEIDRNNAVCATSQKNRNPYVDHPEWVAAVWGGGPSFTSSPVISCVQNVAYSYSVKATCDAGKTLTLACPTLPNWLTFTPSNGTGSATATLTGTPSAIGTYDVDITANDGTTTVHQIFTINVTAAPSLQFTSTPITSAIEDNSYFYGITAAGPQSTITMTCPTLPSWLSFSANNATGAASGSLSGIPPVGSAASYPVDIQITNGINTVHQNFNIVVSVAPSGGGMETITNAPATGSSYVDISWVGDNGVSWNAYDGRTDLTINSKCVTFKKAATTAPYLMSGQQLGGCGSLTFKHKQMYTTTGGALNVYINGTQVAANVPVTATESTKTISNINVSGSFTIKIESNNVTQIGIDDISWTGYSASTGIYSINSATDYMDVFPNPAAAEFTLKVYKEIGSDTKIDIYNIAGIKIKTLTDGYMSSGTNTLKVNDLSDLSSGYYLIKYVSENVSLEKKIIIVK